MSPMGGIGGWGENLSLGYLTRRGFQIVERNFYTNSGEIDIVAKYGGDFYFVEVKTRTVGEMATDLSITRAKRRKLDKVIRQYCYQRNISGCGLILAAIVVRVDRIKKTVKFRWSVLY